MATAKKAAKATKKAATAADVDDVLGSAPAAKKAGKAKGGDDLLEGKKPAKGGKAAKKPAAKKPAKKEASEGTATQGVRDFIAKCRKLTSYADVQEATGADIRMVRRTARAMRDDGEIEIVKEGTVCFVKKA